MTRCSPTGSLFQHAHRYPFFSRFRRKFAQVINRKGNVFCASCLHISSIPATLSHALVDRPPPMAGDTRASEFDLHMVNGVGNQRIYVLPYACDLSHGAHLVAITNSAQAALHTRRAPDSLHHISDCYALSNRGVTMTICSSFAPCSQIVRVFDDKVRQSLFRGWNRLVLHTASLDVTGPVPTTVAVAATAAREKAAENAAATSAHIITNTASFRERLQVAEADVLAQQKTAAVRLVRDCVALHRSL